MPVLVFSSASGNQLLNLLGRKAVYQQSCESANNHYMEPATERAAETEPAAEPKEPAAEPKEPWSITMDAMDAPKTKCPPFVRPQAESEYESELEE